MVVTAAARLSPDEAESIARRHYGVRGSARRLASEHDDAFRIVAGDGSSRLLKVGPPDPGAETGLPSFQTSVLLHLATAAPWLPVQRVVTALDGAPEVALPAGAGPARLARMTSWLDGELLGRDAAGAGPAGGGLRREIGGTLALLNRALRGFSHPGAGRTHQWDLQNFWRLRELLDELPGSGLLPEVEQRLDRERAPAGTGLGEELGGCLDHFDESVRPRLAGTAVQVIHADFHGENLLADGVSITGILDFGDALSGPVAMDVGVAACYQLGCRPDGATILAPASDVIAGYHAIDPLTAADLALAAEFMVARVAARIIVSQWNAVREPANRSYLLRRTPQAVGQLLALRRRRPDDIARFLPG